MTGVRINPSMLTSNDIDVDPAMWSPPEESISLLQQETDNVKAFIAKHFPGCCLLEERPVCVLLANCKTLHFSLLLVTFVPLKRSAVP